METICTDMRVETFKLDQWCNKQCIIYQMLMLCSFSHFSPLPVYNGEVLIPSKARER